MSLELFLLKICKYLLFFILFYSILFLKGNALSLSPLNITAAAITTYLHHHMQYMIDFYYWLLLNLKMSSEFYFY